MQQDQQDAQQELIARARAWLADDPDPQTRAELTALVDTAAGATGTDEGAAALDELAARFAGTLQFGTAGLRAELGAGPMRMNRAVVIKTAAGLASYLTQRQQPAAGAGQRPGLVVIGYDARHRSADFARDTAAVITGAGLRAVLLPRPLPTPVLAFAIRHLGAIAGVEVTASHNPPRDNGYKVYLGDGVAGTASRGGAQIVPPADAEIAAEIAAVAGVREVPRPETGWEIAGEEVIDAYLERATGVLAPDSARAVQVVYTPLHGVGLATVSAAFARAGFPAPLVVTEQAEPDPDFPTVAFPNPEEPGAMDLAFATARAATAAATGTTPGSPTSAPTSPDIVLANDPDADRCAVAVPDPAAPAGWRMLRGDEVGALLAAHLVRSGRVGQGSAGTFATTIVSSSLLSRIAATAGVPYAETLTGFKWLARVDGLRYAYEEALGYCADPAGVRDKDGITAALLIAELAAELKASGSSLPALLDELAVAHGLHATDQLSVRVEDLSVIAAAMQRLRAQPPTALAGLPVTSAQDLSLGSDALPPTDGLRYHLAGDAASGVRSARVIVRPSGTEPKLKCYLEVVLPVGAPDALPAARTRAADVLAAVKRDLADAAGI